MKKNLVLISTFFSPTVHVAANRISAFAQYLNHDDFKITVITKADPHRNKTEIERAYGIELIEIPIAKSGSLKTFSPDDSAIAHKFKALYNKIILFLKKDIDADFTHQALAALQNKQSQSPVDVLITSYSPVSPILVGLDFKKKNPGVYWVADMRDEYAENPHLSRPQKSFAKLVEAEIIKHANLVLSVSEPILNQFRAKKPAAASTPHFLEVRNGYNFAPRKDIPSKANSDVFSIAYTGTFYGDIKPDKFYKALETFSIQHPQTQIEFNIYGGNKGLTAPALLKNMIKVHSKVSYEKIPDIIAGMDALLIVHPTGLRKGVFTTKIFDYLAVNAPILAMVDPDDVAADLIKECHAGIIANTPDEVVSALNQLYTMKREGKSFPRDWDKVEENHRNRQIQKLNQILVAGN